MRFRFRFPARTAAVSLGALALVLATVVAASAHDTWLMSDANFGRVGSVIRLRMTSGELFPNDDFAIEPARVSRAVVREGSVMRQLPRPSAAAQSLDYEWRPSSVGVATIAVELQPRTLVLEPRLVDEYLGEIDASADVRAEWKSLAGKQKWTESYTKHAMTFVRIAPAKRDSAWTANKGWTRPLGLGLELVPERDPTALQAGDTLLLRVLRNGVPVAGFSVGALREGRTKATFAHTDAAGQARVVLDADGRWLLNGTQLRRANAGATVWESDFITATLHVAKH